jgi:hypothetical protein
MHRNISCGSREIPGLTRALDQVRAVNSKEARRQ